MSKKYKFTTPKSDSLFKSIMETKTAPFEFLDSYLPLKLKKIVDITKVRLEKESFVEEDLKKRLSDIVYSVPYKGSKEGKAFIYCLIEHQSTSDKWIAFRLLKYSMLLMDRYKEHKGKLPLIVPMVVYNGKKKYSAPRNIWSLFDKPALAKDTMLSDYNLIDLQSMSDDEIVKKQHFGLLEYFMKHIHQKDILEIWDKFGDKYPQMIVADREYGFIYITKLMVYTGYKVEEDKKEEFKRVILKYIPSEEGGEYMVSVAESYIREGIGRGIEQGIHQGIHQGIERGREEGKMEVAKALFAKKLPLQEIVEVTGLTEEQILGVSKKQ